MMMKLETWMASLLALLLTGLQPVQAADLNATIESAETDPDAAPRGGDEERGYVAPTVESTRGVVAADHPVASRIGARILARGGSAADAGVASLLALGVVNPYSSGLGGGGFCLYRDAESTDVTVVDFRETAPGNAHRDMYVEDGEVVQEKTIRGGLSVGVPGEPAGLWALAHRFGALEWSKLVDPAYQLANDGMRVHRLMAKRLERNGEELEERAPKLADVFKKDGEWVEEGDRLERPNLARTLKTYRDEGPAAFYHGAIGDSIVETVNEHGGIFEREDLSSYALAIREPVQGTYRDHTVYSMPPSSSGGTAIIETLNILENASLGELGRTADGVHMMTEALKHAFADRARWLGDTDFVDVPLDHLTSKDYADKLYQRIEERDVLPLEQYGTQTDDVDGLPEDSGTSHLSVIDKDENMLACTSTINLSFGSMVYVPEWGLVMNDEMGDFTARPGVPNNYGLVGTEQNAVAPGKRPLSSMSPTLVLDPDDRPFMSVGASGGPTIITGTLMAILNSIDFDASPSRAIEAPRIHHQWRPNTLFMEPAFPANNPELRSDLEERGHTIELRPTYSAVQMVVRTPTSEEEPKDEASFTGVSDPRKLGGPAAVE